jgi:putative ABC transport system permease protein
MSIWRMILREVQYRRLNFVLSLVAVAMAVASIVAADIVVRRDQAVTEMILTEKQQAVAAGVARRQNEVEQAGAALQDVMRRTMRELGFNILILPSDQDLSELHLNGTLSRTMPEEYVNRLAKSGIVTVNHLLPSVTRRIRWEEQQMDIILQGTRGEVPLMHSSDKKPLLNAVSPGQIVVGYGIHSRLKLKVDDRVTLMGQEFTVSTLHPERGSSDDVTVWIDLGQAQQLLGMQNLIHAILALECECAGDRISQIRAEISQILPGTQVIERYSQALTRAEARGKAKLAAEESLQKEKEAGAAPLNKN